MKYVFLLTFSLNLLCIHCSISNASEGIIKQNNINQDSILYYAHNFKTDGLLLRISPGLESAIIDTLNYNDSVAVIEDALGTIQFGDLKGAWTKVKWNNTTAFCENIFLCRFPLPAKEEIGLMSLETYIVKYIGKKEVNYKADSKPDHFAQKLFLKNFNITTIVYFFHYLNFIDVNTPLPVFCIDYSIKTNSFTSLHVKSDGDSKQTINSLSLDYWYGNTETSFEFKNENNGVTLKIVYHYAE